MAPTDVTYNDTERLFPGHVTFYSLLQANGAG